MSGYLQYSNYGEDEKPFIQQPQQSQQSQQSQQQSQHKRTLRTKTLRSKQPQQQQPQGNWNQQQPQQQQPQGNWNQQQPQHQPQGNRNQQQQTKYSQYVIQKLHNTDNNGSDSDSDSDNDVYKQFQTEPVFSNTIYAPSSGNDLNSKLNPASAKEGFATNANGNSNGNGNGNALAPPKQYPQYLSSVFQASSNNDADAKDLMLQKLDQIISLLENQQDEKTGHVTEELILYCFLGVFIIFIVDSFARAGKYVR